MARTLTAFRRLLAVSAFAVSGVACGTTDSIVLPDVQIAGSYVATRFVVTPTNQPSIDVLARGGSLTIQIAASNATTGTLIIPQDVFGSAQNVSMAGTVTRSGHSLQFQHQQAGVDSFVEQVGWLAGGGTIATDSNDGSARIEVVLTRQGG